jgi:2-iminobutanoate/2-iminopropanoate deaminase
MRRPGYPAVFLALTTLLGAGGADAEKKIIAPPGTAAGLPFSPGVLSGDFLYLSGAIGNVPGTVEGTGGIEAQVKRAIENQRAILETAGMDLSRVVSVEVFLSDARSFAAMNEVYRTYFPRDPPVRATVQADIAIPGALVEIAMIAARPGVEKEVVRPATMKSPELPYSWGIRAGSTLFIAGATARDPETYQPVGGADIKSQTKRVLDNVGLVLEAAGLSPRDVVQCTVFLDDARSFQGMNEAYRAFFPEAPPSRATVRAKLMNPAFSTEIQCTAVKDPSRKVVSATGASSSSSPLSPAIEAGGRLFVSGMTGRGPDGYAMGDLKAQTRQSLENLLATLKAGGMSYDDVVDVQVFVADIRGFQAMNEVYREMVGSPPPARATVGAQLMSPDALVEIVMLAAR